MTTVSAIVPLYNKRQTVIEAIESILAQTHAVEEIIVVDDGSTDGSAELVEQTFGGLVHLVRQPNAGPGAARNHGMRLANTDYCAFLDADDVWLPHHIAELMRIRDRFTDLPLYASGLGEWGKPIEDRGQALALISSYADSWLMGLTVSTCAAMVHRKVALHLGGFATDSNRGEDLTLWLKLTDGMVMATSDRIGALYRRDASDLTRTPASEPDSAMRWISQRLTAPDLTDLDRKSLIAYRTRLSLLHAAENIRAGRRREARLFLGIAALSEYDRPQQKRLRMLTGPLWPFRSLIIRARRMLSR